MADDEQLHAALQQTQIVLVLIGEQTAAGDQDLAVKKARLQTLVNMLKHKDYFMVDLTVQGLLRQLNVPEHQYYTPNGDQHLLQCARGCTTELYPRAIFSANNELTASPRPSCPHCNAALLPHVRDYFLVPEVQEAKSASKVQALHQFIEQPQQVQFENLLAWYGRHCKQPILLLELVAKNDDAQLQLPEPLAALIAQISQLSHAQFACY